MSKRNNTRIHLKPQPKVELKGVERFPPTPGMATAVKRVEAGLRSRPAPFDPASPESQLALLVGVVFALTLDVEGDTLRPGAVAEMRDLVRSLPYFKSLGWTKEDAGRVAAQTFRKPLRPYHCARAKSDMTPCYTADGDIVLTEAPVVCVGCERTVKTIEDQEGAERVRLK